MQLSRQNSSSEFKRVENPTTEQVEELMDRYTNALQSLFEQYKVEAGYPNDTLKVI